MQVQLEEPKTHALTSRDLESFQGEVRRTLERKLLSLIERACILRRTIGANRKEFEVDAVQRAIDECRVALNFKNPEGVSVA